MRDPFGGSTQCGVTSCNFSVHWSPLWGCGRVGALSSSIPLLICGLLNDTFAKIPKTCQIELMVAQDISATQDYIKYS